MVDEIKLEVVRIHRLDNAGSVKAFCDLRLNDDYVIKGFKIVEGTDGLFVGMPSELSKTGKWFNTFRPLSNDAKARLEEVVIGAYKE